MSCRSDYMIATDGEEELGKVINLIDYILKNPYPPKGRSTINWDLPKDYDNGYDPRTYNRGFSQNTLDSMTALLCSLCKDTIKLMPFYCSELQEWWKNHQEIDKKHERE